MPVELKIILTLQESGSYSLTLHCRKCQRYKREQSLLPASWLLLGHQICFMMT